MSVEKLRQDLQAGQVIVVGGPIGTEIERFGGGESEGCSAHALQHWRGRRAIRRIHYANAQHASLDVTYTFRTDRLEEGAKKATRTACKLTQRARRMAKVHDLLRGGDSSRNLLIGGSVAPIGDCYTPEDAPPRSVLRAKHGRFAEILAAADVDFIFPETQNNLPEIQEVLRAAKNVGKPAGLNVWCSPNATRSARQEFLRGAVYLAGQYDALFVGDNCLDALQAEEDVDFIHSLDAGIPISARPQGYDPTSPDQVPGLGAAEYRARFLDSMSRSIAAGAQVVGGCCGTPWEWTRDLAGRALVHNQALTSISEQLDWSVA